MNLKDDRSAAQKASLTWLVIGTDAFLTSWGKHANMSNSYAAWACRFTDLDKVEAWVRSRSEMKRVRLAKAGTWKPKGNGNAHIYAVEGDHPSLA